MARSSQRQSQATKKCRFLLCGSSLDGIGETNNKFRGKPEAFDLAVAGIRNCLKAGVKTGLRFTVTKYNFKDVPEIFDFIETEESLESAFTI